MRNAEPKRLERLRVQDFPLAGKEVFEALRKAILSGLFHPGDRLVEREIAKQLGVSRTPVRESLRKLELESLVRYIPRRGVVVRGISLEDAQEIYRIREVLEGLATRLAVERAGDRDIEVLNRIVESMVELSGGGAEERERLTELNARFLDAIYRAAASPRLSQIIHSLRDYVSRFAEIGYLSPGRIEEATREHQQILEALTRGDARRAAAATRRHIRNSWRALYSELKKAEESSGAEGTHIGRIGRIEPNRKGDA